MESMEIVSKDSQFIERLAYIAQVQGRKVRGGSATEGQGFPKQTSSHMISEKPVPRGGSGKWGA